MLDRRQMDVQHRNLASMCRITVKSLIDYACVNTHVDEDCEEFVNFCAVFEQMVAHKIRPYQKKVWHRGQGLPRHFWEVMLENHSQGALFRTCIPNIAAIETIKSSKAKLRAFVRVALMEKRLSDYLYWVLNNHSLMEDCYFEGALFTSEEGLELCGDIIGLSAIDFNFCLRGNENELLGPLEINYAPFLAYIQSSASRLIDEEEMLQLSGKGFESMDTSGHITEDKLKLQSLEKDFKGVKEQKDYLEELIRLRERQMGEANMRLETMRKSMQVREREWDVDKGMLVKCVLELQEEITSLITQNGLLKAQVSDLQLFKSRLEFREVQMIDLAYAPALSGSGELNKEEQTDGDRQPSLTLLTLPTSSNKKSSDQRSILSGISDQVHLKEDSQSLVPLTGSLADVNVAMIRDEVPNERKKTEPEHSVTKQRSKDKNDDVELTLFQNKEQTVKITATTNDDGMEGAISATTSSSEAAVLCVKTTTAAPLSSLTMSTAQSQDVTDDNAISASTMEESYVLAQPVDDSSVKQTEMGQVSSEVKGLQSLVQEKANEDNWGKEDVIQAGKQEREGHSSEDVDRSGNAMAKALQDLGEAFETGTSTSATGKSGTDPLYALSSSSAFDNSSNDGDGHVTRQEDVNNSSTSDPEILDKVNTSSDGSDAAWEMLSDVEDPEK